MKKNILKLGLVTLFIIFFAVLMPKDTFAASIDKIEITVPEPVIGETLSTDTSKIQITDESGCNFIINKIEWYCSESSLSTNQYLGFEKVSDFSKKCNNRDHYQLQLEFLFPVDSYSYSSDETILINGIKLNKGTDYILGEAIIDNVNYQSTSITYNFEHAKVQKEISKIEITTPTPVEGEKLSTDISKFEVKIDGTETLTITRVAWLSEDYKTLSSDIIAEAGKKYNIEVDFNIPNKYGLSSDIIVTVNGEKINVDNIEEFNYASSGDLDFDYTGVIKLMDVKETSKEEPKEEPEEEPKEEINKESSTEEAKKNETIKETKNPKTGDSITKSFIISIIAVIGIAFTINSIKKQNK